MSLAQAVTTGNSCLAGPASAFRLAACQCRFSGSLPWLRSTSPFFLSPNLPQLAMWAAKAIRNR